MLKIKRKLVVRKGRRAIAMKAYIRKILRDAHVVTDWNPKGSFVIIYLFVIIQYSQRRKRIMELITETAARRKGNIP